MLNVDQWAASAAVRANDKILKMKSYEFKRLKDFESLKSLNI